MKQYDNLDDQRCDMIFVAISRALFICALLVVASMAIAISLI